MSSTGPGSPDEWDSDDTGSVPVGPEPEPTSTGGPGSGGWGEAPRTEPFAVAALVWAIVSIVLPIVGTIVAFVLAARASDSIKRSRGTRSGAGLVIAARVVAGAVIVLWAIGLILFFALRDDGSDDSNVAVPTQPPIESTTTSPPTTTPTTLPPPSTTLPPVTTTVPVAPTTSIVPPPPTEPPPTTVAPTTTPTTTPVTTTSSTTTSTTTTTTTPAQGEEIRIQNQLLKTSGPTNRRIGPSNRGVPDDDRVVVTYAPGQPLQVVWAINDGDPPLPQGEPQCTTPPEPPTSSTTTTTTDDPPDPSTSTTDPTATTNAPPDADSTPQLARREARNILNVLRTEIQQGRLNIDGVQLVGRFPIAGAEEGDVDVVQVFYTNDDVKASWPYQQAFKAPPADTVQCLDPTFD